MGSLLNTLGSFYITLAPAGDIKTWVGGQKNSETDWGKNDNWSPSGQIKSTTGVIIPETDYDPVIPSQGQGAECKYIIIKERGVVNTVDGSKLTLHGTGAAWTMEPDGQFNAGTNSEIIFTGTGGEVSVAGSTTFNNLTIDNGTTLRPAENSYTGITGTLSNNGILAAATTENTIEFKQNGDYTIPVPNGAPSGYHNLIISGTGTKTLPASLDIYGDFINNGTINHNNGTLTMKALDGVHHKIGGNTSPTAFYDLVIANSTPTSEISTETNITVSNALTVNANATLSPGAAYTVGGTGTLSGDGTVKVTRIASTPDFLTQYPIATRTLTNLTVDYCGTGAQTVNALDYGNLTISANGTRTVTLANTGTIGVAKVFHPDLTTTNYAIAGSTVDFNGSAAQTIPAFNYYNLTSSSTGARTLAASGTIGVAGNFTPGANSFTVTGSTVDFNGSGAQNIGAFTFYNLSASNAGIKSATGDLTVNGDFFTVASGVTLDMTGYVLSGSATSVDNSGTVRTAVPTSASSTPLFSGKTWGGTVEYYGTALQTVVPGTYNNLTMSGTGSGGGTASGDITVNGILSLAANTSTSQGILHTGSNTLYMGIASTTTGLGDVTGIVARNHLFSGATEYTFGNHYTSLYFLNTGIKPDWVKCRISIGSAPSWNTNAINRTYSFAQSGGTDRMIVKLHYLDNELHGTQSDENQLVFWDAYDPAGTPNNFTDKYPRNKNGNDAANNWVQLTGPAINYLATSDLLDVKQWGLGYTNVTKHVWTGNGSPSYDGDWSLPGNWNGGVPTAGDDVVIPFDLPADNNGDKTPYRNLLVTLSPNVAKTLEIEDGVEMTMLDNSEITIYGAANAWVNNGMFNGGNGTVVFSHNASSEPATLSGSGTTNFHHLQINASTTVQPQPGAYIGISGTVTNSGTLDCSTNANTIDYNGAEPVTLLNPNGGTTGYHSLRISGSGAVTLPAETLYIKGDFIDDGTVVAGSESTVELNGSGYGQFISGSAITVFNNLTINNASGVTLRTDKSVNGTLSLTSGLVTTLDHTLLVGSCPSGSGEITNASSLSYVNGKLARVYCGTGSKDFPIGKGGNYRPLTLNYTVLEGTSTVTAEQFEVDIPGEIPENTTYQAGRYWSITQSGGSGFTYALTLDGSTFDIPAGSDPVILKGNGNVNTAVDAAFNNYQFTAAGLTDLSNFAAAAGCPAPTISAHPAPVTVCDGKEDAQFSVTASGPGGSPLSYQWQVDQGSGWVNIPTGAPYSGETTATLSISNPPTSMNGYRYQVVVSRNCGSSVTSNAATLTVNPVPSVTPGTVPGVCSGTTTTTLPYSNASGSPDRYRIDYDNDANTAGFADVAYTTLPGSPISLTLPGGAAGTFNGMLYVKNNSAGCESAGISFTVTIHPLPQGSLTGNTILSGGTGYLTWTDTEGTGPYTVVYNDGTADRTATGVNAGVPFAVHTNPVTTTNYTLVSVAGVYCTRTSFFTGGTATITVATGVTWTGATDTVWNNAANWNPQNVPTTALPAVIPDASTTPNDPVVTSSGAVCSTLEIQTGGLLTIGEDGDLTVGSVLTNNGTLNISSTGNSRTGSLIYGSADGTGTANIQRWMTGGKWHIISSPVSGQTINSFLTNAGNGINYYGTIGGVVYEDYDMISYEEEPDDWSDFFTATTAGNLDYGVGYSITRGGLAPAATDGPVTFTGTLHASNPSIPVTRNGKGWNAIGNPFPSAIRINETNDNTSFMHVNEGQIDANYRALYLWDESSDYAGISHDYVVISNAGPFDWVGGDIGQEFISLGQGFIVRAVDNSSRQITITPVMQSHQTTAAPFKAARAVWPGIRLRAAGSDGGSSTIIGYHEGTSAGMDPGYDVGMLKGNPGFALYSRLAAGGNNTDLAIQSLPEKEAETPVPIGIDCREGGNVTFTAELSGSLKGQQVWLEDRLLQKTADLSKESYRVTLAAGTRGTGRFFLRAAAIPTLAPTAETLPLKVYTQGSRIVIDGSLPAGSHLALYSSEGRCWYSGRAENLSRNLIDAAGFPPGVYILDVRSGQTRVPYKVALGVNR